MVSLFRSFALRDGRAFAHKVLSFSGAAQSCGDAEAFSRDVEEYLK